MVSVSGDLDEEVGAVSVFGASTSPLPVVDALVAGSSVAAGGADAFSAT
jgi:hypothetical protein